MASWYSSLLTKTSSQISSLRATLLPSEADGDTDDDTHVCRVLRNYYTDKGRPLPPWLPPDPKAPVAPVAQPLYAQQSQVGSRYGGAGLASQQQMPQQQPGGLSSLWDSGPAQQQQNLQPQSLRAGSRAPQSRGGRDDVMARPLPSQRAGSYQNAGPSPATPQPGPGGSAQDRLRQRLRGGPSSRTSSPAQAGPGPYQPPPPAANSPWSGGGGDDYNGGGPGPGSGRWGGGGAPGPGPGARQGLPAGPRRQGLPPGGARGYR
ncbi:Sec1-binding of Mso1 domain-containing protein [Hirsutella rhossiliensis]|uniref:Sec1-binding of mso1 domain-containing protein n=1 Tax=Hirsutella rhossiliensis TaxID=111463 RepID=A0A9P8N754_9HYPO|nr:sec1-binding of mso1 domain-containing protein [Hirsutella rhossiliensis]KAH0968065.1 sec1-binding of mso1 domain-containing protein [Hirsutella rhossiliensis]